MSEFSMEGVWPDLLSIDPDEPSLVWLPLQPGVDISRLHGKGDQGISAALLRYQPGASVPAHRHVGHEYLMILRGSQRDERAVYRQGTFVINSPNTSHKVSSDEGCVVLAIWEKPVEFIE